MMAPRILRLNIFYGAVSSTRRHRLYMLLPQHHGKSSSSTSRSSFRGLCPLTPASCIKFEYNSSSLLFRALSPPPFLPPSRSECRLKIRIAGRDSHKSVFCTPPVRNHNGTDRAEYSIYIYIKCMHIPGGDLGYCQRMQSVVVAQALEAQ